MITATKAYMTTDGKTHASLDDAKRVELENLLTTPENPGIFAGDIVKNAEAVIDILTTAQNSRPRARRVNGGRKPRKSKAIEGQQLPLQQ